VPDVVIPLPLFRVSPIADGHKRRYFLSIEGNAVQYFLIALFGVAAVINLIVYRIMPASRDVTTPPRGRN
jgi:hypothetical protein